MSASDLLRRFPDPSSLAKELVGRGWLTPQQADQLLRGDAPLLLGPYVILERLGEGGMGRVFKARHTTLGRLAALKVIRNDLLTRPDTVRRFRRETQAAARLTHPNVVLVYDASEQDGTHFLAMDYLEGRDLAQVVRERGPLSVLEACEFARQAALGLQHAHESGLVHRDVKPSNLLLTRQGQIKLLDLGLSRLVGEEVSKVTQEGAVLGTPDFMAPEQAEGAEADARSDLYGLGCTLYFLLTGQVPFPGGTMFQKLQRHQAEEPEALERLRPDVGRVVRKRMAKRPADRYQSAAEFVETLAPSEERPAASTISMSRPRRVRGPWVVLGSLCLVGILAGVLAWWGPWHAEQSPPGPHGSEQPARTVDGKKEPGPVTRLSLQGAGDDDLRRLASYSELKILDLRDTAVTDEGLPHLRGLPLRELTLPRRVTDAGLVNIRDMKELRTLRLAPARANGGGLVHLYKLDNLESLALTGTAVDDTAAGYLPGVNSLRELDLSGASVTDSGLEHLARLSGLRKLTLARTALKGPGLKHLQDLRALEELDLSGTGVTDAGLAHLRGLASLLKLDLRHTKVTEGGVLGLRKALPRLKQVVR
jgi:serine/threonine-protein kinase